MIDHLTRTPEYRMPEDEAHFDELIAAIVMRAAIDRSGSRCFSGTEKHNRTYMMEDAGTFLHSRWCALLLGSDTLGPRICRYVDENGLRRIHGKKRKKAD